MNESLFNCSQFAKHSQNYLNPQNPSEGGTLPSPPSVLQTEKPGLEKKEASHGDTGTMKDHMCGMS